MYFTMATVPHLMVKLERMLDYRGVGAQSFHCTRISFRIMINGVGWGWVGITQYSDVRGQVRTYVCICGNIEV